MNTKEIWRLVPSLGDVLASSEGRLMVCPRLNSGRFGSRHYGGEPTTGQWDGARYIYHLRGKTYKTARLVCEAFHGPAAEGQVCMHLDENSRNNRPENLRGGTQKENLNAPGFLAYCKGRTGESSPLIKGLKKRARATTAESNQ